MASSPEYLWVPSPGEVGSRKQIAITFLLTMEHYPIILSSEVRALYSGTEDGYSYGGNNRDLGDLLGL
jgi:hypothetical protein